MTEHVEAIVVGAGVVGLAVGRALALAGKDVLVVERHGGIGEETSSRNSEIIHAGVYYPKGSLKARLCRKGKEALYAYLKARGIAHRRCGKLIVATRPAQMERLAAIDRMARDNAVDDLSRLSGQDVRAVEPAVEALAGLLSPSTGILDTHAFMLSLQGDLEDAGGVMVPRTQVAAVRCDARGFIVATAGADATTVRADILVNCAGLDAARLARHIAGLGAAHIPRAFMAIGHYYVFSGKAPFSHLIYPVPEPGGLGVHVTLDLGGQARFGPDVRWIDARNYDFDDSRRADFIAAIKAYYPRLDAARLHPGYTGIRPKIVGPGEPPADFRIDGPETHGVPGLVNLFGIESPGLTASLAIADEVVRRLGLDP
ncbi:MAG: NAD(P)/FAD-dependent oxidoreductase [Alphaproteobacteria bacterium]|nr:MAG: NAD(P)/FAD-dependent oxidoreductase [Alphaproteobacteria bacterium]